MDGGSSDPGGESEESRLYTGGDGSSVEAAVVVHAPSEVIGVRAEYDYIAQQEGQRGEDWNAEPQALLHEGDGVCDAIDIRTCSGEGKSYYFDVTEFFGKM